MELELRAVIHYCYLRGLTPIETEAEMKPVYGRQMCHIKTIRNWFANFDQGRKELSDLPRSGRPADNTCLDDILNLLDEQPFISARRMAEVLGIPKTTVLTKLHDELDFIKVNLRWVPHFLSNENKQQRVEYSQALLEYLESGPRTWNQLITGDQSWIYWDNPHTSQWVPQGNQRPIHEKHTIASKKSMITVFFGLRGFVLVNVLKKGERFNSAYMVNEILPSLSNEISKSRPKIGLKGIHIHIDNAKAHNSKMTMNEISKYQMIRLPHPAYSPDIAPCDFWFFGKLKEYLKGMNFESDDELLNAIITFSNQISKSEISSVFEEWIRRLHLVIESGGEYVQ